MYRIGICSREQGLVQSLKHTDLQKTLFETRRYRSLKELEADVRCGDMPADILILDLEESIAYIDLAKTIQERDSHVQIIFIGKNKKDIAEIFKVTPAYILLKPIDKEELSNALQRAVFNIKQKEKAELALNVDRKMLHIPCHEILYIESDLRYLKIHRENRTDRVLMKMAEITGQLPDYFVRCHQSYMVNMEKIRSYDSHGIEIEGERHIPVSRNRRAETKEAIGKYYRKKGN